MRSLLKWAIGLGILLIAACLALWFFALRAPPPGRPLAPLTISSGPVRGLEEEGVAVYRGIPYAAPPVGDLRWREPHPVAAWTRPRDAFAFSRTCMQVGDPIAGSVLEPMSEDCLYLNVWTPVTRGNAPLPVMVWIHGGGNRNGSASAAPYSGAALARKGVVVISVNYRLGALGFLAHPELTRESGHGASGNYGLMDIIAALKWVRTNAPAFGGDPANVTMFGQSAGAWNISNLQVSPLARGLYRRAIAMSGGDFAPADTPHGIPLLPEAEQAGTRLATRLGADSLAKLRTIPASAIVEASKSWPAFTDRSNVPGVVDGYVLTADPYRLYASGAAAPGDLLAGYTSEEGATISGLPVTAAAYQARIRKTYGAYAERVLALYPARSEAEANRSHQRVTGEEGIKWPVATWARLHAGTRRGNVFLYRFSHRPGLGPFNGIPSHGTDMWYVFDFPERVRRYGSQWPWDAYRDIAMIDDIQNYWVNFARTGNPNGAGLPQWPEFSRAAGVMELGKTAKAEAWPDAAEHRLMDDYMGAIRKARGTPASAGAAPR